jgi:hypothetical protein
MMIFETLCLNALDFLSLLSGANFDEVEADLKEKRESGRVVYLKAVQSAGLSGPAFFFQDDRFFLEVLFLKLSFLGELIKKSFSGEDIPEHPDPRFTLDRIWVKFPEFNTLSPFFWNFKVMAIDLDRDTSENPSFPESPASNRLHSLGMVWFHTLLINKKQSLAELSLSLREGENRGRSAPAFLPVNIFWDPGGKTVREAWHPFWEKSLGLGWSLLRPSPRNDPCLSMETFWQELENVRQEVKERLFREPPVEVRKPIVSETEVEDEDIHRTLLRILKKWRMGTEIPMEVSSLHPQGRDLQETIPETILLSSPEGLFHPQRLTPKETDVEEKGEEKGIPREETLQETLLRREGQALEGDLLIETVILGPKGDTAPSSRIPPRGSIIGDKRALQREPEGGRTPGKTGKQPMEEDVPETVILVPGKVQDSKKRNP